MKTTVNDDLSSITVNDDETLEFLLPDYNVETLVPFNNEEEVLDFVQVIANNQNVWTVKLSDEEKQQLAHDATSKTVRSKRNQLLVSSDWTQVIDAPVDQTAWATYRQALRDLPAQDDFPFDVVYPDAP